MPLHRVRHRPRAALCAAWFLAAIPARAAEEPPRLLLLDLAANGVSAKVAASLTDLLAIEVERGRLFSVVTQEDLRALLKAEELERLLGAGPEELAEAMARLAKAADAPWVLRGSVGRIGGIHVLSATLLDARQAKAVRRVEQNLVGDERGLVGSVRTLALALTLEEKGVAPDISAALIDRLKIAEKAKTLFLALSTGWEVPMGAQSDSAGFAYFRPSLAHVRLDVELQLAGHLRAFLSAGWASTVGERLRMQDKHYARVFDADTGSAVGERVMVAETAIDYSAYRVPVHVGVKLVPEAGRFLPYGLVGVGAARQRYAFSGERLRLLRERASDGSCAAPFGEAEGDACEFALQAQPNADVSTWTLDLIAAAGLEWLLSHHLGLRVEARWGLAWTWEDEQDLHALFVADPVQYEEAGARRADVYGDTFPTRALHQGLVFSAGAVAYW